MAIEAVERGGRTEGLHHIGPAVERAVQDITKRAEARSRPNPLWDRIVMSFEREWSTPWKYMDSLERGIVRVIYRHEKKEAVKPKPERKPVVEVVHRGYWAPVQTVNGK